MSPAKPSTTVEGRGGTAWQYRLRGWTRTDWASRFEQESLRRFIAQGLYGRHLRRTGNLYRRKCALLTQAVTGESSAFLWSRMFHVKR